MYKIVFVVMMLFISKLSYADTRMIINYTYGENWKEISIIYGKNKSVVDESYAATFGNVKNTTIEDDIFCKGKGWVASGSARNGTNQSVAGICGAKSHDAALKALNELCAKKGFVCNICSVGYDDASETLVRGPQDDGTFLAYTLPKKPEAWVAPAGIPCLKGERNDGVL